MTRRSALFTPGNMVEQMRKALSSDADILIFDLEDAVGLDSKSDARTGVNKVLSGISTTEKEIAVRINPYDRGGKTDLRVIDSSKIDSIVVPKMDKPDDLTPVANTTEDINFLPLIESARGLSNALAIAEMSQVEALLFGAEDFAADIGANRTSEGMEILYAREKIVVSAAATGVDAIDTVFTNLDSHDDLQKDAELARQLGYDGKLAIHPTQLSIINDVFSPSEQKIEWAKQVLQAKRAADKDGKGVFRVDGQMIDGPLIDQAKTILQRVNATRVN